MATDLTNRSGTDLLTEREVEALVEAAAWYFKYSGSEIDKLRNDGSAHGVLRREHFDHVHGALWKLGVRMRHPGRGTS